MRSPDPAQSPVIIDSVDPGFTALSGDWRTSSSTSNKLGADHRFASTSGTAGPATAECEWRPHLPLPGICDVSVWYNHGATDAP